MDASFLADFIDNFQQLGHDCQISSGEEVMWDMDIQPSD
jgi:hypothetical protein